MSATDEKVEVNLLNNNVKDSSMFRSILASAAIPATPWNEDDSKIGSREMGLYREPRKPSTAKALAISIVGMAAIVLFAWIAFYVVAVFQFSVK